MLAEDGELDLEVTQSAERMEELEDSIWSVVRHENERWIPRGRCAEQW